MNYNYSVIVLGAILGAWLLAGPPRNTPPAMAAVVDSGTQPYVDEGDIPLPREFAGNPPQITLGAVPAPVDDWVPAAADILAASADLPVIDEATAQGGPSAFSETPPDRESPAQSSSPAVGVFRVSVGSSGGTAVAIGPNTLLTAAHVARYATINVEVDGSQVPARVTHVPNSDTAILTTTGQNFPSINIRKPQYYEPVKVYGTRSNVWQSGLVTAFDTVSITPGSPGTVSGDSGGAVLGSDGSLVGIIRGVEGPRRNPPSAENPLVVKFEDAPVFLPYLPTGYSSQQPVAGAGPSAFDDVPVTPPAAGGGGANSYCTSASCAPVSRRSFRLLRGR